MTTLTCRVTLLLPVGKVTPKESSAKRSALLDAYAHDSDMPQHIPGLNRVGDMGLKTVMAPITAAMPPCAQRVLDSTLLRLVATATVPCSATFSAYINQHCRSHNEQSKNVLCLS